MDEDDDHIDHIYQKNREKRPGTVFFYLDHLKKSLDVANTIIDKFEHLINNATKEDSGISDDSDNPLSSMPTIVRPMLNFPDISGILEASTSRSSPYSGNSKSTRKRKHLSNSPVLKPVSKRRKKSALDKSDEESNNQILRNSLSRPKRKRTLQNKEESSAEESPNEDTVYAQPSVRYFRRQRSDSPEDSTADESQAEEMIFPPTVARSARRKRRDNSMLTPDESQGEDMLNELRKRPIRRQKRQFQVESDSQNEIMNAMSRNSGISRRSRRKAMNIDDDTSQDENLTELEDQQTEEKSYIPNPRNLHGKFKRKQSLQNKRDKIDSQEELSADDSQSELLRSSFSFKSIRMLRRGSQEDSTANESQNDELGIKNPTSVKRRKGRIQIKSKKSVSRNTGLIQDDALTSETKTSCNKLIVKCYDILTDPSFESDPVVKKFKKDKLLHCDSPRDDESSGKDKTHDEILNEVYEEPESSKNKDGEDKNHDTEDIKDSLKQAPSAPCESDSATLKNTVLHYIRTSRRGRRVNALGLSIDDSSQKTHLDHLNISEKEDVHPTSHELLSDRDIEKKIYSTDVEQGDKPEKEFNEDNIVKRDRIN